MPRVTQGSIQPISAKDLHLDKIMVPVRPPGVHCPEIVSQEPLVVGERTIEHAKVCALRLIGRLETLPHTAEAGDLLAMAYTILHYTEEK